MKNKDIIKELAELCSKYGLEIMDNVYDEDLARMAYDIYASANNIIKELEK